MVQRNALVYRRVWRGSVFSSFLQPTLFLLAMGLGLGAMVDAGGAALPDGVSYAEFLAPGLLAAAAMQAAGFESTYPVLGKMMWFRNYEAITRHADARVRSRARRARVDGPAPDDDRRGIRAGDDGVRHSALAARRARDSGGGADRARICGAHHGVCGDAEARRTRSTCCSASSSRRCFCSPACSFPSSRLPDPFERARVVHAAVPRRRARARASRSTLCRRRGRFTSRISRRSSRPASAHGAADVPPEAATHR